MARIDFITSPWERLAYGVSLIVVAPVLAPAFVVFGSFEIVVAAYRTSLSERIGWSFVLFMTLAALVCAPFYVLWSYGVALAEPVASALREFTRRVMRALDAFIVALFDNEYEAR